MSELNPFSDNEDLKISKLFLEKIKKDQDKVERLESPKFVDELKELLKQKNHSINYELEELDQLDERLLKSE